MFTRSARLYDFFYEWKNYAAEASLVHSVIQLSRPGAHTLLDVACGTGKHLEHFRQNYDVAGVDVDPALLEIAARRNPGVPLVRGDMLDFSLQRSFDVVTCLFSSIGYLTAPDAMARAVANMARHLTDRGLLIVEPWFAPDEWKDGHIGSLYVDRPELKAVRMNVGRTENRNSVLDFQYLVATSSGVEHFSERHVLRLFTDVEYRDAFTRAGLDVIHDEHGLDGRGVYIGTHSQ